MVFPIGQDFYEQDISPSQNRVKRVWLGEGRIGFQDPDRVYRKIYRDGRISAPIRNPFIRREEAARRLAYNIEKGIVIDSFGQSVAARHLRLPGIGRTVIYKNLTATWKPLTIDPRRFRPGPNQEIIERIITIDRAGNLRTVDTSYGRGMKYDKSRFGGRWVAQTKRALGIPREERVTTDELQRAVVSREFILKELRPHVLIY